MSDASGEKIEIKHELIHGATATSFDIFALGMCAAIGGLVGTWNYGFSSGFGSLIVAMTLVSFAYFSLLLCLSELASGLPFAGLLFYFL